MPGPREPDHYEDSDETYELAEPLEDREPAYASPVIVPPTRPGATGVRCVQCGYDLSGTAVGGWCPECGAAVAATISTRQHAPGDSAPAAVTCLVLGVLSVACCALTGPFAIYFYSRAKGEIATGGYSGGSDTMALIGLILGIIGTGVMALQAVFFSLGFLA